MKLSLIASKEVSSMPQSAPRFWTAHNDTRQTLLGDRIRKADTYLQRLIGLLPRHHLEAGEGLWIIPCRDIHSMGMRFAFDALFLDRDLVVVHRVERMKPFRISRYVRAAQTVLELDAGVIAKTGTQKGDQIRLEASGNENRSHFPIAPGGD